MAEFFKSDEVASQTFVGAMLIGTITRMDKDEDCPYNIDHSVRKLGVDVELKLDGHEVSMRDFLKRLEDHWEWYLTREALKMSENRCNDILNRMTNFGDAVEQMIRDKFPELPQDDDY